MAELSSLFPGVIVEYPHEGGLYENELNGLLTWRMGSVFKGVYCIDEVNVTPIESPAAYVVNTKARWHWLTIYTNTQGVAIYFDIFGMPPHLQEIIEFFNSLAASCL